MKISLSEASGVPFWRQVRDQIALQIQAGLPPGTLLPGVRQLAAESLVSVITIKRAYDELEAAGLIVQQQGRGSFVASGAAQAASADLRAQLAQELRSWVERARAAGLGDGELASLVEQALGSDGVGQRG